MRQSQINSAKRTLKELEKKLKPLIKEWKKLDAITLDPDLPLSEDRKIVAQMKKIEALFTKVNSLGNKLPMANVVTW